MKESLLRFLMVLMLMPGLACAMPSCIHASEASMSSAHPCQDDAEKHGLKHAPMSNADCAKADLYAADNQIVKKTDLSSQIFIPAYTNFNIRETFLFAEVGAIRGPPPRSFRVSETQHPLFLTTLRIRQ